MMIRGKSLILLRFLAFLFALSSAKSTLPRPLPLESFKINTIQNLFAVSPIHWGLISVFPTVTTSESTFNVLDFGAVGDGQADDTFAFNETWNQVCPSPGKSTFFAPKGIYRLGNLIFAGKCRSSDINFELAGTIIGGPLLFKDVDGLTISGGGVLNGTGKHWRDVSRKYHPGPAWGDTATALLAISKCQNVQLSKIVSAQSGGLNFNIYGSQNVTLDTVTIENPKESPNTDGIHISNSSGIFINNCNITTGDNCISLGDGVSNYSPSNNTCWPS